MIVIKSGWEGEDNERENNLGAQALLDSDQVHPGLAQQCHSLSVLSSVNFASAFL